MFDYQTERCLECDGHFRHFAPCPYFTEEPVLSVEDRVALAALVPAELEPDLAPIEQWEYTTPEEVYFTDADYGYDDWEPSPYGGTYSEM